MSYTRHTKRTLLLLSFLLICFILCSFSRQLIHLNDKSVIFDTPIKELEMPQIDDSTFFVTSSIGRYSYLYCQEYRQSKWVAHILTQKDLDGKSVKRATRFLQDSVVLLNNWKSASTEDYYRSNFDRGHLLPSADRNKDKRENQATFLLTNISPQKANLNRKSWADMENRIRDWARAYDSLYIVTGVIINDSTKYIGKNLVIIPDFFYKVVLSKQNGELNAIGFVMPNDNSVSNNFMEYCKSVREIEQLAKENFYNNLPDSIQNLVENRINYKFWSIKRDTLQNIAL